MKTRLFLSIAFVFLMQGFFSLQAEYTDQAERLDALTPDNRIIAEDLITFMQASDDKYFAWVNKINEQTLPELGDQPINDENFDWTTEYSDYNIRVVRGPVIEKTGRMLSAGKMTSPGRGDKNLVWGRFYSIDIHPKTPLVGMLHATIVLQFFEDNSIGTGGWLDVMPGTRIPEDLEFLKQTTDDYFQKHNANTALYRRLVCKGTEDTIEYWRRKPSCSGVSFYGPPVFRDSGEKSYMFIKGMFTEFVDAYLQLVEKRMNDSFTKEDVLAQETMRRRWLMDQLFSDPFASKIVPFEVWSAANVPPTIKF
jgi:coproporphyrinogen III oxidase